MGVAKPLFAKLFLEGFEVPLISATCTSNVGQASIAYIEVPPLAEIVDIKPRTHVMLAVRDLNNPKQGYPFIKAWEGEVYGFSLSKTPSSRNFTISAIDLTSYWDNALLYFFNAQQSLGKGGPQIAAIGQDVKDAQKQGFKVQATTHSLSSYFIEILKNTLKGENADLLDGLVEIYKNTEKINSFFKAAEERLRITDRIRLRSSGELEELLKAQEGLEWITGIVGQDSGYSSLRQTVQKLMSLIFHDFTSILFPSKIEVDSDDLRGNGIKTGSRGVATQGEFIFKPNFYMMPPPACNIFYPDEYSQFAYSRMFFQEPTRLIYQPQMPSVLGGQGFAMEHVYEPNSFEEFMLAKEKTEIGDGPLQVSEDQGSFGDADESDSKETNQGAKREPQFLTNEEKMRGILMTREGMAPASTLFRAILDKDQQRTIGQGVANYLFFKKRFEPRQLQITSQLKLSVVPGFTTLVLDPQDVKLSLVAYCSSVTHRFTAQGGGYTTVSLNYARTVDEQDTASSSTDEPPIPPWFSPSIFGGTEKDENGRTKYSKGISEFYSSLIGKKGNRTLSDLFNKDTLGEAVEELIKEYRTVKEKSTDQAVSDLISRRTDREYVKLTEAMSFMNAKTTTKDLNTPFIFFEGEKFSGGSGDGAAQVKLRRETILKYRNRLATERGFRG